MDFRSNSDKLEKLFDKYVPADGKAATVGGEIVRAMSRLLYRFFNDGDMVGSGEGWLTCNGSYTYLDKKIVDFPDMYCSDGKGYRTRLEEALEKTVDYLDKNVQLFEQPNTEDSREISTYDREGYNEELMEDDDLDSEEEPNW